MEGLTDTEEQICTALTPSGTGLTLPCCSLRTALLGRSVAAGGAGTRSFHAVPNPVHLSVVT